MLVATCIAEEGLDIDEVGPDSNSIMMYNPLLYTLNSSLFLPHSLPLFNLPLYYWIVMRSPVSTILSP